MFQHPDERKLTNQIEIEDNKPEVVVPNAPLPLHGSSEYSDEGDDGDWEC